MKRKANEGKAKVRGIMGEMEEINNSQKANHADQLGALGFKTKAGNHNLPKRVKRTNSGKRNAMDAKRNEKKHKTNMGAARKN